MEQTLLLLQLSDSAFPTGGFSHSLGLESSVQHKQICNTDDLKSFITSLLENAGSFNLPFVVEAHTACTDFKELQRLDRLCHVCTSNHIANKASSRQGKAMADTASKVFQTDDLRLLTSDLHQRHHAVVFGAVSGNLGLPLELALASFMSGVARTAAASAVRLDQLGPVAAQTMLAALQKLIPGIISSYCHVHCLGRIEDRGETGLEQAAKTGVIETGKIKTACDTISLDKPSLFSQYQ